MRIGIVFLAALLGLTGCLSIGGGGTPERTTVVVPAGSTCTNSNGTPCTPQ